MTLISERWRGCLSVSHFWKFPNRSFQRFSSRAIGEQVLQPPGTVCFPVLLCYPLKHSQSFISVAPGKAGLCWTQHTPKIKVRGHSTDHNERPLCGFLESRGDGIFYLLNSNPPQSQNAAKTQLSPWLLYLQPDPRQCSYESDDIMPGEISLVILFCYLIFPIFVFFLYLCPFSLYLLYDG